MAESDRRRIVSSTPHLTPEEVLQRAFATSFRGYAEADVRAFLKRVSEELAVTRERESELLAAIDALEERLRSPQPLDETQLLDALGAETSRLLRSARDAADEIRTKADELATQTAEAANADAERVRGEADEFYRSRTEEAEARGTALVTDAEERAAAILAEVEKTAAEQRANAEREVEELVEAARQQGREMLDEAKATRERVLADLFRRRELLQSQVDELRGGRDNLLDAYRVVKRTFLEATDALARVEARAAERAAAPPEASAPDTAATDASLAEASMPGDAGADVTTSESGDANAVPGAELQPDADEPSLADVDSLFARIRAGQAETAIEPTPAAPGDESGPDETGPDKSSPEPAAAVDAPASGPEAAPAEPADESEPVEEVAAPSAVDAWRAVRADVVDPLLGLVAKRAKRAAQDDQNALLDAVRRHKGRPTAAQVLTAEPDLLAKWVMVIREAIDEAYGAGRVAAGGEAGAADDQLVNESAAAIVSPVRERIASAIDAGEEGDTSGLVERIGARFREWKNQSLENALADTLAISWSRGVYEASPDGATLRWIPLVEGHCADCDDNGLEPTVKGSSFPTGQVHPPAHPGCRCLLAPSDVLSRLGASV